MIKLHDTTMARTNRKVDKSDPKYEERRRKNNEAIRKTRAKAKAKQEQTQQRLTSLKKENDDLEARIRDLAAQLQLMKNILEAHHHQLETNVAERRPELLQLVREMTDLSTE